MELVECGKWGMGSTRTSSRCRNPSFGLETKARACEGAGQEWSPRSHFMFPRVWESVKKWTSTLPNELPLWRLESRCDFRGQNPLDRKVFYIIGNLLELRCLKWVHMIHLGTQNTSYGQKKGQELNCQFDSQPLKVRNFPDFLACGWFSTYF